MKYLILMVLVFCGFNVNSQTLFNDNFVNNGSFETYTSLPQAQGEISKAVFWNQLINHQGTTDYYYMDNNAHWDARIISKKGGFWNKKGQNKAGAQMPFNDGKGYAGIMSNGFDNNCWSTEYFQTQLKRPLIKGVKYKATMYVSHAEESAWATSNLGMLITKEQLQGTGNNWCIFQNVSPQVITSSIITEEDEWVKVEGSFIAEGGEEWLTIGVFNANGNNRSRVRDGQIGASHILLVPEGCYYFVDEVSVIEEDICEQPCANNNLPMSINGVINPSSSNLPTAMTVNTNPFSFILDGAMTYEFRFFNRWGNLIWEEYGQDICGFSNKVITWNGFKNNGQLAVFVDGTYTYAISYSNCTGSYSLTGGIFGNGAPSGTVNTFVSPNYTSVCLEKGATGCCVDNWFLENMNITQNIHLKAEQLITTEDVNINMNDAEIGIFQAGEAIIFSPETDINVDAASASFEAKILPCNSVTSREVAINDDHTPFINIVDKSDFGCLEDLVLKPNPFRENLVIEIQSNCNFVEGVLLIQNTLGEIVREQIITYESTINLTIDFSNFQSGIYYIIFVTDNGRIVRKAMKI
jgi:hypothetical protein